MLAVVAIPSSPARAADDSEAPRPAKEYAPQAEDQDRPHDKSLAIWGGETLYHTVHGGDVRPCSVPPNLACAGQGEPK
jgi:hypothetical protein